MALRGRGGARRGHHPLVTALSVYRRAQNVVAAAEAIPWNTDTNPWFLWQAALGGIDFALGSTIAIDRGTLARIGGLEGVADCMLEDYLLGKRAAAAGVPIRIAPVVIEVLHRRDTWAGWWERQRRWLPAYRSAEPLRYALGALTFGPTWGLALALLHPSSELALAAFLAPLYARWCLARIIHEGPRAFMNDPPCGPLRPPCGAGSAGQPRPSRDTRCRATVGPRLGCCGSPEPRAHYSRARRGAFVNSAG